MEAVNVESREYYDSLWASMKRLDQHHKCRLLAIENGLRRLGWKSGDGQRRILELGSGSGMIAELLAKYGEITGVDQSPVGVQTARSRVRGTFVVGTLPGIDVAADGFDLVVLSQVVEHFTDADQRTLLENARRKVRAGGYMLLTTPNRPVASRIYLRPGEAQPIENWLDPDGVVRLLGATGWRVVDLSFAFSFFPVLSSRYRWMRGIRFAVYDLLGLRNTIESLTAHRGLGDCTVVLASKD
jgi:SAM-dependent methyltransferase